MEKKLSIKELQDIASDIYKKFQLGVAYKASQKIDEDIRRAYDFVQGDQWKDFRKKYKIETPSLNICANIVDSKQSSINSKTYRIKYDIAQEGIVTDQVTKFSDYQTKEMNLDKVLRKATYDGLIQGTMIVYCYYTNDKLGFNDSISGGLVAEPINVVDFVPSNPNIEDVQKQEYLILHSRESIKNVRERCTTLDEEEKKRYIVATPNKNGVVEQDTSKNIDIYTRYFRINGEVYYEIATENILIVEPTSSNPITNYDLLKKLKGKDDIAEAHDQEIDSANNLIYEKVEKQTEEQAFVKKMKAYLYPFAVERFIRRHNSFFGISYVKGIIPIQKAINQLFYANILSHIKSSLPTIVVKQGALGVNGIDLTNPQGIIIDRSPDGVDGIKALHTGQASGAQFALAQNTISLVKDIYRSNDILNDGRSVGNGMSAVAIQQLNSIQEMPVAQMQESLIDLIKEIAKILEQFYKLYFRNSRFIYETDNVAGLESTVYASDTFNGEDYLEVPFNVTVEVGEGARYSEMTTTAFIETLFNNGIISRLTTDQLLLFIDSMPNSAFPDKKSFKKRLAEMQNSENQQLRQQIEQLQAQLDQSNMVNGALRQEFTDKINIYNDELKKLRR